MKRIILGVLLLTLTSTKAQSKETHMSLSTYTTVEGSAGIEVRGGGCDWYVAAQLYKFKSRDNDHHSISASSGFVKRYKNLNLLGGIKLGITSELMRTNFAYGLEAEVNSDVTDNLFIGLRLGYDKYVNKEVIDFSNFYLKLGYRFNK